MAVSSDLSTLDIQVGVLFVMYHEIIENGHRSLLWVCAPLRIYVIGHVGIQMHTQDIFYNNHLISKVNCDKKQVVN